MVDLDGLFLEFVGRRQIEPFPVEGTADDLLDRVVGQDLVADIEDSFRGHALDPVLAEGSHGVGSHAERLDRRVGGLGHRVHHARLGKHVDKLTAFRIALVELSGTGLGDAGLFDDRVDEQRAGDVADAIGVAVVHLDQVAAGRADVGCRGEPQFCDLGCDPLRFSVAAVMDGVDVYFKQHHESVSLW